ncbi:MAG: flagellar basal body-associated FliL family protein [Mariprofundaceae bacterium]|nr:flagellar basal body-associated FliL family protein [Mariprofundaceae bacterium]
MADQAEEATQKKSGSMLQVINLLLLLLVLGVGGFVAWKMVQMDQAPAGQEGNATEEVITIPEPEEEDPSLPPVFVDIADITINLADAEVSRFLRAKIKLEVRNEDAQAVVEQNMVKINDMVITLLSSKTFAEIRTPQGKYELKEDLIYRMNRLMSGKPIKNLYFTDFVSQ